MRLGCLEHCEVVHTMSRSAHRERYNSRLILAYCEISPYVLRPLIHALKLWASAQQVNDPSGAKSAPTMSSYCLTLMAIAFLQFRGHLPNLQTAVTYEIPDVPSAEGDDIIWVGWGKDEGTKCHVGFDPDPPKGWTPRAPDLTAEEALRGFFEFYSRNKLRAGEIKFDFQTQVVSILNGGIMDRAVGLGVLAREAASGVKVSKEERVRKEMEIGKGDLGLQPRNWSDRRLVVQDPFIWQKVS